MDKKKANRLRVARLKELRENTLVDANTMLDVLDEATEHLINNFNPAIGPQYRHDYTFTMGSAFLDTDMGNDKDVHARVAYSDGDLHAWSHDLAAWMADDREVCSMVLHSIEIYGRIMAGKGGGHE